MGILALAADERVADVTVLEDSLIVRIMDGRIISVPLVWFPRLLNASEAARKNWTISGGGYGIHWPDIDEDLSTEGLLRGAPAPEHDAGKSLVKSRDEVEHPVEARSRGIWDYIAESEEASHKIVHLTTVFSENSKLLTKKIQDHTERLTRIKKARGSAQQIRAVAGSLATDLNTYSGQVEQMLPKLDEGIESLESIHTEIIDLIDPSEPDSNEAIKSSRSSVDNLLIAVRSAKESIIGFRVVIRDFEQKNFAAQLTRASSRLLTATEGLLASYEGIESYGLKIMFRLSERFGDNK